MRGRGRTPLPGTMSVVDENGRTGTAPHSGKRVSVQRFQQALASATVTKSSPVAHFDQPITRNEPLSVSDRVVFPPRGAVPRTHAAHKSFVTVNKNSPQFDQLNALLGRPTTIRSAGVDATSRKGPGTSKEMTCTNAAATHCEKAKPINFAEARQTAEVTSSESTQQVKCRYQKYGSFRSSFASASNFSSSSVSLCSTDSRATLASSTGFGAEPPQLNREQQLNIMQRFVEILQEHQRSTKTDTLRVQVLCERYSKRYGESMHPKKFKALLGNPRDMAAAIRNFRPHLFDHVFKAGDDYIKLAGKALPDQLLSASTPKAPEPPSQLDLREFVGEAMLNEMQLPKWKLMWSTCEELSMEPKPRWQYLIDFAEAVHAASMSEAISLSKHLATHKAARSTLDAYHLSAECAAFVLCAYFEQCFEVVKGGSDFVVKAIANVTPTSVQPLIELLAAGEVTIVEMADRIVLGKTYEAKVSPASRCTENVLSLKLVGLNAYEDAKANYTMKLKKLFEHHPDIHYALRRPQAGDYVVYKHHRCVVESSSNGVMQLYEIDTGEHFSNVSPSEVFDPLFTDRYSALPALALRAKLEWPDGKPLSSTVIEALESLKRRSATCKAYLASSEDGSNTTGRSFYKVKLAVIDESNGSERWLPESA